MILAGGAARRLGGGKPSREVAGRPLVSYPADALAGVVDLVAIVGKPGDPLPEVEGAEVWDGESAKPRHPATGIVHALERAGGPVLVCAADMPFVRPEDCRALIAAAEGEGADRAQSAIAAAHDALEPLLGVYVPEALETLRRGAAAGSPMRTLAAALTPVLVELSEDVLRSVNTPDELAAADRELRQPRSST